MDERVIHKFDDYDLGNLTRGIRCGFEGRPGEPVPKHRDWRHVTCKDCLVYYVPRGRYKQPLPSVQYAKELFFYCDLCKKVERVSRFTDQILHRHGAVLRALHVWTEAEAVEYVEQKNQGFEDAHPQT